MKNARRLVVFIVIIIIILGTTAVAKEQTGSDQIWSCQVRSRLILSSSCLVLPMFILPGWFALLLLTQANAKAKAKAQGKGRQIRGTVLELLFTTSLVNISLHMPLGITQRILIPASRSSLMFIGRQTQRCLREDLVLHQGRRLCPQRQVPRRD